MKKETSSQRNKKESKQRLVDAVGAIITRDGFQGVGINSVAKEANLDKVLIYRYFEGLDGLLREFARQKDFYINLSDRVMKEIEKAQREDFKELIVEILVGQLNSLKHDKELQELMLWEMVEKNELTIAIAREREKKGYEISNTLKTKMKLENNDSDAVIALLVAGIYYLVLRSRTVDIFNGIELDSEDGWQKIEAAIKQIVGSYFKSIK